MHAIQFILILLLTTKHAVLLAEANTIIWAGLQGTPPRYIDQGEKKGLGYNEVETKDVRAALVDAGFIVKREYYTSTRLKYEFTNKRPVCFYPVEWMPATEKFAPNPERILSLPLNFSGEEVRYIIFRKGEEHRFDKHFDAKGNLNLDSLIRDKSLRAVFPNNRDLPDEFMVAIAKEDGVITNRVDQEFAGHISMIVPSENYQMLAMLNGKRYDYTLSQFIESADFNKIKSGRLGFEKVEYVGKRLKAIDDPAIVYHSVACAIHPATIAAMPFINSEIKQIRGYPWVERTLRYQTSFDPNVHVPSYEEVIPYRFAIDLQKGKSDEWYSRQVAVVPNLLIVPRQTAKSASDEVSVHLPPQDRHLWIAARPHSDALWLINAPDLSYYQTMQRIDLGYRDYTSFRAYGQRKPFFPITDFQAVDDLEKPKQRAVHFADLDLGARALAGVSQLVVYAAGIEQDGLPKLEQLLATSAIKKLAIIDAGVDASEAVVNHLSPQLEELNLAYSSFNGVHLGIKVRAMKGLRVLNLHNTTMDREDFAEILRHLPPTLEELYLGWQNNRWDESMAEEFSRLRLPRLRILDLENGVMDDLHLKPVLKAVGEAVEVLNLSLNYATSDGLLEFFSRPHPKLRHLNLAKTALSALPSKKLKFPDTVEALDLSMTDLNSARLANLQLPAQLRYFSARENELSDADLKTLLPRFAPQMEALLLNSNRLEGDFLEHLTNHRISKIGALALSNNPVREASLRALAKSTTKVSELSLQSVQLGNETAKILLTAFGPVLKNLDLCETLVTGDVLAEARAKAPGIRQLRLCSILDLDAKDLSTLPSGLVSLDLGNNRISDAMLEQLATHLPKSLRSLNIINSRFGRQGAIALSKAMPPLHTLVVSSPNLDDEAYRYLALGMPNTLRSFQLARGKLTEDNAKSLVRSMPRFLQCVELLEIETSEQSIQLLVASLPATLRRLALNGAKVGALPGGKDAANLRNLQHFVSYSNSLASEGLADLLRAPLKALVAIHIKAPELSVAAQTAIARRAPQLGSLELNQMPIADTMFKELKAAGMKDLRHLAISTFSWAELGVLDKEDLKGLKRLNLIGASIDSKNLVELVTRLPRVMDQLFLVSTNLSHEDVDALIAALPHRVRILRVGGNNIGRIGIAKFRSYKEKVERETGYQVILEGVGA